MGSEMCIRDIANEWLGTYLQQHNRRFAVAPREAADLHQPWRGTSQALREICALHHQRQLSAQGACRFEGKVLQIEPAQPHAPAARAMVDICLLYTSDAADERSSVDLGGRRILKKKKSTRLRRARWNHQKERRKKKIRAPE